MRWPCGGPPGAPQHVQGGALGPDRPAVPATPRIIPAAGRLLPPASRSVRRACSTPRRHCRRPLLHDSAHDQARRVARRLPDRRSLDQAPAGSRHRVAEGDLRVDRRDRGERPADGQQAARPGVLGGQEPMAVTGPCAKAEFAPGRSTLVSVSGQRTFGPLSIVPETIALRQQWFVSVRSGEQGGATREDPHRSTPHIRRPLLCRAGHHATPPLTSSLSLGSDQASSACPSLEAPESSTSWIEVRIS